MDGRHKHFSCTSFDSNENNNVHDKQKKAPSLQQLFHFAFIYMHVTLWHARETRQRMKSISGSNTADEGKHMIPNNGAISKNIYRSRRHDFVLQETHILNIGIALAMIIEMISDDRFMKNVDGDGEYDGERSYKEAQRSIAGWGVVPRMAPTPSQGGSTLRERDRKR